MQEVSCSFRNITTSLFAVSLALLIDHIFPTNGGDKLLSAEEQIYYGAGTSSRTAPILEQIPKNSPKKQELAGNSHTS
jgi:hypothetical protein